MYRGFFLATVLLLLGENGITHVAAEGKPSLRGKASLSAADLEL